jgi:hypothetical protein
MHLCTHDRLRAASVEELETEDWLKYLVQQPCSNSSSPGCRDQATILIENWPLEINGWAQSKTGAGILRLGLAGALRFLCDRCDLRH